MFAHHASSMLVLASATAVLAAAALQVNAATLPQARTENGVTYINGGVGRDEATAMKAQAKHYPLSLMFSAGKQNEFLADVKVTIKDQAGKEILETAAGPILLVNVPAGTYAVAADANGTTLHRTVRVGAKGDKQIVFHWPKA
jgi:hypothetical protein